MTRAAIRKGLRELILECAAWYEAGVPLSSSQVELLARIELRLTEYFSTLPQLLSLLPESKEWQPDADHTGYLRHGGAGTSYLLVPWTLAGDFPSEQVTAELTHVARELRIGGANSTICLSGSAALSGSIRWMSDVDFCVSPNVQTRPVKNV